MSKRADVKGADNTGSNQFQQKLQNSAIDGTKSPNQKQQNEQIQTNQADLHLKQKQRTKKTTETTCVEQVKKKTKQRRTDRENIEIMRNLLTQAKKKNVFKTNSQENIRLEFSHTIHNSYYGHKLLAKGIIFNPNTHCFTTFNDRAIHVWDPMTSERLFSINFDGSDGIQEQRIADHDHCQEKKEQTKTKGDMICRQISCMCYSKTTHLYFLCMRNFKLVVLNEYLNLIIEIPLKIRLVTECVFIDETSQLICAGQSGCYLIQMNIHYGYAATQAILLDPKGNSTQVSVRNVEKNFNEKEQDDIRVWLEKHKKEDGSGPYLDITLDEDLKQEIKVNTMDKLFEIIGNRETNTSEYLKFLRMEEWVKGIKVFKQEGFIVLWNEKSVNFYEYGGKNQCAVLETIPAVVYNDLTSKEDFVTDVLIYNQLKYICVATNYGNIRVFKWNPRERTKKIIQTLKGHTRSITSLMMIAPKRIKRRQKINNVEFVEKVNNEQSTFVSASLDGSIRIWCLEKLIELYNFDIINDGNGGGVDETIKKIQMIDESVFVVFMKSYKNRIDIGQISHLAQSYFISKSKIQILNKAFLNYANMASNKTDSLMISFDNNSTLLLWPDNGLIKSIVYPPPTPSPTTQVIYCMAIQRVFVLLASGTLCLYKVHNRETATLDKIQFAKQLKDYEDKSLTVKISAMNIVSVTPPQFDCEIFSEMPKFNPKTENKDNETSESADEETSELHSETDISPMLKGLLINEQYKIQRSMLKNDNFLVVGLETGTIIFVNVRHLEYIYARFSVHRQNVVQIQEMREKNLILSMCVENKLHIWGFENNKFKIYQTYNIQRPVLFLRIFSNNVLFNFNQGEQILCVWQSKKVMTKEKILVDSSAEEIENADDQLVYQKIDEEFEHEDQVLSFDIHQEKKLIVTSDANGLIKVWDFNKKLLREIKFTEAITAVCFLNQAADLMAGHGGKLSRILADDYLPIDYQVNILSHRIFANQNQQKSQNSSSTLGSMSFFIKFQQKTQIENEYKQSLDDLFLEKSKQTAGTIQSENQPSDPNAISQNKGTKGKKKEDQKSKIDAKADFKNSIHQMHESKNVKKVREEKYNQQKQLDTKFDFDLNVQVLEEAKKEHQRMFGHQQKQEVQARDVSYKEAKFAIPDTGRETRQILDSSALTINQLRCGNVTALPKNYMDKKIQRQKQMQQAGQFKTRRQITEDRIVNNIKKCNDPSGISNSLFDMQLMGTQAASNYSQFTNLEEPQTASALERQNHIADVLQRSEEGGLGKMLDNTLSYKNSHSNFNATRDDFSPTQKAHRNDKQIITHDTPVKKIQANRNIFKLKTATHQDLHSGQVKFKSTDRNFVIQANGTNNIGSFMPPGKYMVQTLAPKQLNKSYQNFKSRRANLASANYNHENEVDRAYKLKAFLSHGDSSSQKPLSMETGPSSINRPSYTANSVRPLRNQRYNSAVFHKYNIQTHGFRQNSDDYLGQNKLSVPAFTNNVYESQEQTKTATHLNQIGQKQIDPRFHVDIRNKQQLPFAMSNNEIMSQEEEFKNINAIQSMSLTQSNFLTNPKQRGKSPYSAFGNNRGIAGRDMAIKHVKNTILSAKTRHNQYPVGKVNNFAEQKITIQNWSKQISDQQEVQFRDRDPYKNDSRLLITNKHSNPELKMNPSSGTVSQLLKLNREDGEIVKVD